jgi:leucyl/phenylalanyl-tRNA---protein transferase
MQLTVLNPQNAEQKFPPLHSALKSPNGLLAIGGCLSNERLINAYRQGIFPWYNPDEPILWWSPDPRLVLYPNQLVVSRSLRKTLRKQIFTITYDQAFSQVLAACASPRKEGCGTWITREIDQAFNRLHQIGIAHSAEAWSDGELVGGVYGLALGQVFFGESMFHTKTDASKVAFATLVEQLKCWGYQLIDCQVHSSHLESFGATDIDRYHFAQLLDQYCEKSVSQAAWLFE